MKKNYLFYVLMMVFSITFFSACGDDDDPTPTPDPDPDPTNPTETTWKDGAGDYKGATLTINGMAQGETSEKGINIAAGTGDNAKITLTNAVPEAASVVFDNITMTKAESNYTFKSETTVTGTTTTLSIEGTLSGIPATKADEKKIDIKVTRKINSPLVGMWRLYLAENGAYSVFIDAETGVDSINMAYGYLGRALGGMIAAKVTNVTLQFPETGLFNVTWMPIGADVPVGMPEEIAQAIQINYFTTATDNQVFIALDKATVDAFLPLLPMLIGDKLGNIDLGQVIAGFDNQHGFYVIPINMAINDDHMAKFFVSKEMLSGFLPIFQPLLGGLVTTLPAEMLQQVGGLLEALPTVLSTAERFDVGLEFQLVQE